MEITFLGQMVLKALTINKKKKISAYPIQPEKIFLFKKNHKNTTFWSKMLNSQQTHLDQQKIKMINGSNKNESKFFNKNIVD